MRSVSAARRPRFQTWVAVGALFAALGCWTGKEIAGPSSVITSFITQVSVENTSIVGVYADSAPTPAGGPTAAVNVQSPVVQGGSVRVVVSSATPFQRVVLGMGANVTGVFVVDLPAPVTSTALIITVSESSVFTPIPARFSLGTSTAGPQGDVAEAAIRLITVGTGDVQVSAAWNSPADVDLYVVDPNGEEIFYGHRDAASGGTLDLDSNAGCGGEDKRAENIVWPIRSGVHGTYTVRINYWASCNAASTNWVVTVRTRTSGARTYTGSFSGLGVGGASGAGQVVTTFTY